MAAPAPAPVVAPLPAPADPPQPRLARQLGRLDAVCLLVTAIVALDLLGAVASGGLQSLTWLAIVGALFLVPAALAIAELGSAFPAEGGAYVWTRLAFGRGVGAVVAFFYCVDAPVWLGGSLAITAATAVDGFLLPVEGAARWLFVLGFVWTVVAVAALPVRGGRWVTASGAVAQVALLALVTVTAVAYALEHGVQHLGLGELVPDWSGFVALAPVLVYGLVGFELPSAAAGEMRDPARDVPAAIARGGALTLALYAVPVLAILAVLPPERVTSLSGFVDAMQSVFTVYGGHVQPDGTPVLAGAGTVLGGLAAAAFVWVLLTNGLAWVMSAARVQAVACLDGAAPRTLGRFSARTGTPVRILALSGLVASATAATAFAIAGDDADRYFAVVLTLSIALIALANLAVFPAVVRLRRTHAATERPYRVPGGSTGVWLAAGLATGWCVLALVFALVPGLGSPHPDAALPDGFDDQRLAFTASVLLPLAALGGTALAISWRCRRYGASAGRDPVPTVRCDV